MMEVSVIPDRKDWPFPKTFHYVNNPEVQCEESPLQINCPKDDECIVTAIGTFIDTAASTSFSDAQRKEAIISLIHLVGDIHNPMHLGFAKDVGGNRITLISPARDDGKAQNLHHVWDFELLSGVDMLINARDLKARIRSSSKEYSWHDFETVESGTAVARRIASDIFHQYTCNVAYTNSDGNRIQDGDSVDETYLNSRKDIALELLKQAGVRLALILNRISHLFYSRSRKEARRAKNKIKRSKNSIDKQAEQGGPKST